MNGYALSQNADGSCSYREVTSDMPLKEGETFFESDGDLPQVVKDWFASHPII